MDRKETRADFRILGRTMAWTFVVGQGAGGFWTQAYGEGQRRPEGITSEGEEGELIEYWKMRAMEDLMSVKLSGKAWRGRESR